VSRARQLGESLVELGDDVDASKQERLLAFAELILKWNRAFNLISRRDEARIVPRHLLDGVLLNRWLGGDRVGDLGSGAGLPGIPLAIVRPEINFTLIDRSERRTRFIRQACIELRLTNVEIVTADIDSYRPEVGFDTVVTRAVGHPEAMWLRAQPLLAGARGARALLQCGEHSAGARFAGAGSARFLTLPVPGLDRPHYLWVVEASE
jgi:16S rRNA (guanine527-N7)-methyltransferase